MPTKIETFGLIKEDGKIYFSKRNEFDDEIKRLFKIGTRCLVTVEKVSKKRSNQQNRYYWLVIRIIKDELNNQGWNLTDKDVHEMMKLRFLKTDIINLSTGEVLSMLKSTSALTTTEEMEYITDVCVYGRENLGCIIPEPNEQTQLF
jgi:hypothetical protein